jgi:hypothetical protein
MDLIEIKKKGKKPKKALKFVGAALIILIGLLIISLLIIPKELKEIQNKISQSDTFGTKQGTGLGELGNINPLGKEDTETTSGGGGGGSGGGESSGGGSGGGDTPKLTEEEIYSSGILEIKNRIDAPYTNHRVRIGHWPGASEGINEYDHTYGALFNPSNVASKIVSAADETDLDVDSRPLDSKSTMYLELSLVSQSGSAVKISSSNEIRISMPLAEYVFEDDTITIQQYDPNGIETFPPYNVKELIQQGGGVGIITLPNLSGSYNSQEPYAYFKLIFS